MTEPTARHLKLAQEWLLKQEEPEYVEGNLGAARIVRLAALLASVELEYVGLARRLARLVEAKELLLVAHRLGDRRRADRALKLLENLGDPLAEARAAGLLEEKP